MDMSLPSSIKSSSKNGLRHQRMAEYIHRAVSEALVKHIKDARAKLVTVTHVTVDPACRHANIYFINCAVDGQVIDHDETLKALSKASGFIRTLVAKMMKTRFVPNFHFRYDYHIQNAHHISSLIDSISS